MLFECSIIIEHLQVEREGVTHLNSVRREDLERRFPDLLKAVLLAKA
jgi:hypothetical protein